MSIHSNFKIDTGIVTQATDPTFFNGSEFFDPTQGSITKNNPTKRSQAKRKVDELELNEAEVKSPEEAVQVAQAEATSTELGGAAVGEEAFIAGT